MNRPMGVLAKDTNGAGGIGFEFQVSQIGRNVATAATFLWSCVAHALSR